VRVVSLDHQVIPETLDPAVLMDKPDHWELLVLVGLLEILALPEITVLREQLDCLVMRERWVIPVILELMDSLE